MTSATGATSPEEARELHVAGIHLRRDGHVMRVMGLAQEGGSQRLRASKEAPATAACRGVQPSFDAALTSAPACSSHSAVPRWLWKQA